MSEESKRQTSSDKSLLREQARSLLERLIQAYPAAFSPFGVSEVKPLKLGVHKELAPVIAEWGYGKAVLKYALGMYTRQLRYQIALLKSDHRIDLQGAPSGEISDMNRQVAQEKVNFIKEKRRQSQQQARGPQVKQRRAVKKLKSAAPSKGVSEKALAALQRKFNDKIPQ